MSSIQMSSGFGQLARSEPTPFTHCRCCNQPLHRTVIDLGLSPLCESLVTREQASSPEVFYPLRVLVCDACWLVQLPAHVQGSEIFNHSYAYLSSMSTSWLQHCRDYTNKIVERLSLDSKSLVVEVASNDGYLLQYFHEMRINCLGIEPATTVAALAQQKMIPVVTEYFGSALAARLSEEGYHADLMIGNNVLAHVPDVHDFLAGYKQMLKANGTITFEFQHLLTLIERNQFDTIYQEHYCYFSLLALMPLLAAHDLRVYDVEEIPTHGGSLRIYACHSNAQIANSVNVDSLIAREISSGLNDHRIYEDFSQRVREVKWQLLEFLIWARRAGKRVVGYGAPGKGNTLLNYCGIREDLIEFTVDRNPLKQETLLVGSRIPVFAPSAIDEAEPDYILILPWNIRDEIIAQLDHVRRWGARFVIPIPQLEIIQ